MLLDVVKKGTTDYSVVLRIVDSTDGTPETGVVYNTAGIDLWYKRGTSAATDITEATQTESGAHSDGGFVHIADGYYRLDLPDAAVASGAEYVDIGGTVTGMIVIGGRIRLVDNTEKDVYDRLGAPAGASVSADIATIDTVVDSILVDTAEIGVAGAGLTDIPNGLPTKNVARDNIPFYMVDNADHVTPETGLTVTAQVSKDSGTSWANATGNVVEVGNGLYKFNASQADMNADDIVFKFTAAGADAVLVYIVTRA